MPIPSFITDLRAIEVQRALQLLRLQHSLRLADVQEDESCPICLVPLESIFEEETTAERLSKEGALQPSTSSSVGEGFFGVVKLDICGHIFCRKDLAEWIESFHGSCPTCRQTFFEFTPINEADYESSDGGEYVPGEDEDEFEDDDFFSEDDMLPSSDRELEFDGDVSLGEVFGAYPADVDELNSNVHEEEDFSVEEGAGGGVSHGNTSMSESLELTDGSESPSSDDLSFNSEGGNEEAYAADVSMLSGDSEYENRDEVVVNRVRNSTHKCRDPAANAQPQIIG